MLLSMTGFGKGVAQSAGKKITIEVKSLNSKQFDINTRVPSSLRVLDLEMRNTVGRRVERGKVDMIVSVETSQTASSTLNVEALGAYKTQIEAATEALGLPAPADIWSLLMRMPDIYATDSVTALGDDDIAAVHKALDDALDGLMAHRRAEGERLEAFFAQRIEHITKYLAEVPRYETQRIERIKMRLADGLSKIPAVEYDKGRLEQEMIFYIEKLDVNEEKQRLGQHLRYFMETMHAPEPGQGKKLGFIAQEMGREINTLGSKSNDADMQRLVVMMKDELEQIKEQVLNVM